MAKLDTIKEKYKGKISNINDLTGGKDPSILFYLLANKLDYLLENDPELCVSKKGVEIRRKLHNIIKKVAPLFLYNKQVYEDKNELLGNNLIKNETKITLPSSPVIWVANHAFKDDVLATVLAAKRHAYILLGSIPQFYNTFDGITSYLNGVVLTNRKVAESRKSSISKAIKAMEYGADLIIFPEGVWNKTPNQPMLNLWPGVYRIAQKTGAAVVPIVHYAEDMNMENKKAKIHTVIDEPIDLNAYEEKEALQLLRDKMSTWYMLMLEKYSKLVSRDEALGDYETSQEVWEDELLKRTKTASRYDIEIETIADYRSKELPNPVQIWEILSNIENISAENIKQITEAKRQYELARRNDFQRRF